MLLFARPIGAINITLTESLRGGSPLSLSLFRDRRREEDPRLTDRGEAGVRLGNASNFQIETKEGRRNEGRKEGDECEEIGENGGESGGPPSTALLAWFQSQGR